MIPVFVYGTLKRGGSLNRVLKDDTFMAPAITLSETFDLFPGGSFPYMWKGSHKIAGEVYLVSQETLEHLDYIEGVPSHYKRVKLDVVLEDGKEVKANAYMAAENYSFHPVSNERIVINNQGAKEWRV